MKTTTKATLAAVTAVLTLVFASPAFAQGWSVQFRGGDHRAWRQGEFARHAYDNGFRRGFMRGERDARLGIAIDFRGDRDYRRGDWGFVLRFGPRDYYRSAFREGFEAGYREAFFRHRRPGFGMSFRGRFRY